VGTAVREFVPLVSGRNRLASLRKRQYDDRINLGKPAMPHVCPWWGGYFIDNPLRRLIHNPGRIVAPYIQPGMTVMDVGCGMGLFSIAAAKIVGDRGLVISVDLQKKMPDVVRRRAGAAGVANRIRLHKCEANRLGVEAQVDFALALMMVHEVPDQRWLLSEIRDCLKPDGKFLLAEPKIHVPGKVFGKTVALASDVGFKVIDEPRVRWCRAVVLARS
jgi:SAM-dependent methyltransferase